MADNLSQKLRALKLQKASSRFRLPYDTRQDESSTMRGSFGIQSDFETDKERDDHNQGLDSNPKEGKSIRFSKKAEENILTESHQNLKRASHASVLDSRSQTVNKQTQETGVHPSDGSTKACKNCGRCFNEDSWRRHERVCEKVFVKKRKVFDSARQRLISDGSFPTILNTKSSRLSSTKLKRGSLIASRSLKRIQNRDDVVVGKAASKSNWRKQSSQFRAALAALRGDSTKNTTRFSSYSLSNVSDAEMFSNDDDRIQCPYCSRRFSQTAHERHVSFCKTQFQRKKILNKSGITNSRGRSSSKY